MVYLEYIHRSRIIASQFETSANVAVGSRGREVHLNSLPLFNLLLFHERRLTAIKRYSRPAAFLKGFPGFLRPLRISNQSYFAIYSAPVRVRPFFGRVNLRGRRESRIACRPFPLCALFPRTDERSEEESSCFFAVEILAGSSVVVALCHSSTTIAIIFRK